MDGNFKGTRWFACRDYNNPKMKMLMLKEKMEAPENFQIPVNYETNTMFIHLGYHA